MSISANREIIYPDSDGQPIADNTKQFRWIVLIKENLEILFANDPEIFVAGDLLWYPVEGHPEIRVALDVMYLRAVEETESWVSPKLGIKFIVTPDFLEIYRPENRKFLCSIELEKRAEKLATKLRELRVDPEV